MSSSAAPPPMLPSLSIPATPSPLWLRLCLRLALCTALCAPLVGCSEDDAPPQAEVRFLHSVDDLGPLDVLIDGELVATLAAGELSGREQLDAGNRTLALRSAGANAVLRQVQLDLQADQTHLVAFTGALSLNTLQIVAVDQPVPENLPSGQAAIEVVNLLDSQVEVDVYVDDTLVAAAPPLNTVTPFVTVPASAMNVRVFNAGDDPQTRLPVLTAPISLSSRGAAMLVLNTAAGGGVEVEIVPVR